MGWDSDFQGELEVGGGKKTFFFFFFRSKGLFGKVEEREDFFFLEKESRDSHNIYII